MIIRLLFSLFSFIFLVTVIRDYDILKKQNAKYIGIMIAIVIILGIVGITIVSLGNPCTSKKKVSLPMLQPKASCYCDGIPLNNTCVGTWRNVSFVK